MLAWRRVVVVVSMAAAAWGACAQQPPAATTVEPRVALVIGNGAYRDSPLPNPVNDARAMKQALERAGFDVITRENSTQRDMLQAIREFGDRLRAQGGVGLFYFAGHGMQVKGRNFLVPVGAGIEHEDEVAALSIDANVVLDKMEAAGNRLNMLILDACRNNPFARSFRSLGSGLAPMDAPVGTLIAFATAPGAVAVDGLGAGKNGLYTQHLLAAMHQPGAKVEDVFKRVRTEVRRESKGRQIPWESTSLEGDFYFHPPQTEAKAAPAAAAAAPSPAATTAPASGPRHATAPPAAAGARTAAAPAGPTAAAAGPSVSASARAPVALPSTSAIVDPSPSEPATRKAPQYRLGDHWTYRTSSVPIASGQPPAERTVRVVEQDPDGGVRFSDGERRSGDGRLTSPGALPQRLRTTVPFPIREGERFTYDSGPFTASGGIKNESRPLSCTVGRHEVIDVPVGRLGAWRVECNTTYAASTGLPGSVGGGGVEHSGTVVLWYSPLVKRYVKARQAVWAGGRRFEWVYEMTQARLQ